MPWQGTSPNQTFTRTDGTRVGSTTWTQADAAGVKIVANGHDTHDTDISDGVSACLKKDGGNAATANLQMGGFTLTNLGAATARSHPPRYSDVQDNKAQYVTGVGGTADAITLSPDVAITGYTTGQRFSFIAAGTNTGVPVTVNVSGQGVKALKGRDAAFTDLPGSTIIVGVMQDIEYDGTRFQYMGSVAAGGTPTTTLTGDVTGSGAGSVPTTIANDAVTNAKLANMTNGTFKMGSSGDPIDATSTQATAGLNTFTSALKGLTPASGGGTTKFLRADGSFELPTVTTVAVVGATADPGHYLASCTPSFAGNTWTLTFTQALDNTGGGGGGGVCFPAGSLVRMADGSERAIETIGQGDLLWSPTGPATVDHLHVTTLGWRKYWRMADDSLFFSDEHPLVVERDGDYRLWSMNIDMLMQEAERGEIPGIDDWDWMYEGAAGRSEAFVTLSGLNHTRPVRSRTGAHSKLPLYMPLMVNNELIAVNGYVVGGNIGPGCDYKSIDWKGL